MLNTFDFYSVEARTTRKRELLAAGIAAVDIRATVTWQTYGARRFPRTRYSANLGYVDLAGRPPEAARIEAENISAAWRARGVAPVITYHAVD